MQQVHTNLFIGTDEDCTTFTKNAGFAIVHSCKSCHQKRLENNGTLSSTHPHYLVYEEDSHLYLNLLDLPTELLPEIAHPMFKSAMEFIHREIQNKKVLIHCKFGMSRSPSIGLAYLAISGVISNNSFKEAINDFLSLYPGYAPGTGITFYMKHHWDFLMKEILTT